MNQYSPRLKVTLRRAENNRLPEDISGDVIAVSTHKAYGNPIGKYKITLPFKPAMDAYRYDQAIKPNDIILVELDPGNGSGLTPVMIGLVDESKRVKQVDQEGKPHRTVQICCSDFGKILVRHHCQWYLAPSPAHIGSEESLTEAVYGSKLFAGGTPATIAKNILDVEVYGIMPWTKDYFSSERISSDDNWYLSKVLLSYQEPVWQALRNIANEPYNKLHADTLENGKYGVILEQCPFDANGRLNLQLPRTLHFIGTEETITEELGVNDLDRITYLYQKVDCGIFGEPTGQELLYIKGDAIQYNKSDVAAYGFMPWMPQSMFVPFPASSGPPLPPHLADYKDSASHPVQTRTKLLWDWYRKNAEYESGLITMHGRPDIRCGDGIVYDDNNFQYLVEQVAHSWIMSDHPLCTTSLHVTRGQQNA